MQTASEKKHQKITNATHTKKKKKRGTKETCSAKGTPAAPRNILVDSPKRTKSTRKTQTTPERRPRQIENKRKFIQKKTKKHDLRNSISHILGGTKIKAREAVSLAHSAYLRGEPSAKMTPIKLAPAAAAARASSTLVTPHTLTRRFSDT